MKKTSVILILLFFSLVIASMSVGGSGLGIFDFVSWMKGSSSSSAAFIFSSLRIPRTITCLLVGLSLGFSGALLQTMLANPLAEPYTLGLSGGASLGAVIAILLGVEPLWLSTPAFAFTGCLLATLLVATLSRASNLNTNRSLILVGVMISLFCGSLVILILNFLSPFQLQSALIWMMGQVGTERDHWWPLLFIFVVGAFIWSQMNFEHLDRLLLGDEVATSLGTHVPRLKLSIIVIVATLTALSVSMTGLIGFVGLLSPHLALSIFKTKRHRIYLFVSASMGALILLSADILGRGLGGERELPAGGLIALLGAPLLIYFLVKREKNA